MTITNFNVRDLNPSNLALIKVVNKSADRSYGRRFELVLTDEAGADHHSKELVFKKIFHKVNKLALKEITKGDVENLKKIGKFLEELKEMESDAATEYKTRDDCLYKFRTWWHRLFTFGSHQDKIIKLSKKINKNIDELEIKNDDLVSQLDGILENLDSPQESTLDMAFDLAKQISGTEKRDAYLDQIAEGYATLFWKNLPILKPEIFEPLHKWVELAKVAGEGLRDTILLEATAIYLRFHNDSAAAELIELITDEELKAIAMAFLEDFDNGSELKRKNDDLIDQLDQIIAAENFDSPEESALDTAFALAKQIRGARQRDHYLHGIDMDYGHLKLYDKALEVAKIMNEADQRNRSLSYLVAMHLDLSDDTKASEIIKLITDEELKNQCFYTLADFYLERMGFDKASEIIELITDEDLKNNGFYNFVYYCKDVDKGSEIIDRITDEALRDTAGHFLDFIHVDRDDLEKTSEIIEQIPGMESKKLAWISLVRSHLRTANFDKAAETIERITDEVFKNYLLFLIAMQRKDLDKASEIMERITDEAYKNAALVDLEELRIDRKDLDKASELEKEEDELKAHLKHFNFKENTLDQAFGLANKIHDAKYRDLYLRRIGMCYSHFFIENLSGVDVFDPLDKCIEVAKEASEDPRDALLSEIIKTYKLFDNFSKASEVVELISDQDEKIWWSLELERCKNEDSSL